MAADPPYTPQSPEYGVVCSFSFSPFRCVTDFAKRTEASRNCVRRKKDTSKKVRGNRKFCKRSDDVFPGEWIHFCYPESVDRCTGFRCESAMGDILTPVPLPERSSGRHALFRGFEWIYLGNAWKVAETFLSSLCHQTNFSDVMRSLYAVRISARKIKISVLLIW
jgi:hypothetical protein